MTLASRSPTEIVIEVFNDRLVATMPGSSFHASYVQRDDTIIQTTAMATDFDSAVARKEFEDLAWEAATSKGRELGWIK